MYWKLFTVGVNNEDRTIEAVRNVLKGAYWALLHDNNPVTIDFTYHIYEE